MSQRAGETDELLLAGGKSGAALSHRLIETLGQRLNEIQQIHALGRFGQLLIGNSRSTQPDVVRDGPGEQVRVLQYHAETAPQFFEIELADIDSAEAYG